MFSIDVAGLISCCWRMLTSIKLRSLRPWCPRCSSLQLATSLAVPKSRCQPFSRKNTSKKWTIWRSLAEKHGSIWWPFWWNICCKASQKLTILGCVFSDLVKNWCWYSSIFMGSTGFQTPTLNQSHGGIRSLSPWKTILSFIEPYRCFLSNKSL